jgi:hypothetical protein
MWLRQLDDAQGEHAGGQGAHAGATLARGAPGALLSNAGDEGGSAAGVSMAPATVGSTHRETVAPG